MCLQIFFSFGLLHAQENGGSLTVTRTGDKFSCSIQKASFVNVMDTLFKKAGREYALTQQHKHLKEMKAITGLERTPLFSPIIDDYYSGMVVSVPLFTDMLEKKVTPEELLKYYAEYYKGQEFIEVSAAGDEIAASGFLAGNEKSGWDGLKIYVTGNEERIVVSSQFDNLGKGASGAAIQCMNIVLGCDAAKGLDL